MNRKSGKRIAVYLITAALAVTASAVPAAAQSGDDESSVVKEETVYVKAEADGTVNSVIVSDWLKGIDETTGELEDASILTDIVNVKGDETPVQEGEKLTWPTAGSDIFYQGNTDRELPVGLSLKYFIDDEELSPEKAAGRSGHVRIAVAYENHTAHTAVIDGKEESVVSPFIMLTAMLLPADRFRNITVDHGQVISDSSRSIVIGFGMPGANESLGIEEGNETGLMLPEGFVLEADTDDFSFDGTVTVALSDLSDVLREETENLNTDGLIEKLGGMLGTAGTLLTGAGSISESLDTDILGPAAQLMTDGETLKEKLTGIAGDISGAKKTLRDQAQASLDTAVAEVNEKIDAANLAAGQSAQAAADQANAGLARARTALDGQIAALTAAGEKENSAAIAALTAARDALTDVTPAESEEISHISSPTVAAPELSIDTAGMTMLLLKIGLEYSGIKQSADTLLTQIGTMKTDLDTLLEDAPAGLLDTLKDMFSRARLMAGDADCYDNFSGKAEGMEGSVRFIIETGPVSH